MKPKTEVPEISIFFSEADPYHRLRCDCGCNHFLIVQEGLVLKSNIQVMSLQCVECETVLSFHPESTDGGWKDIN